MLGIVANLAEIYMRLHNVRQVGIQYGSVEMLSYLIGLIS